MSNNNDFRLNAINPLAYIGVNPRTPVPFFCRAFDPTPTDYANFILGTLWLNTDNQNVWLLVKKVNFVSTWVMISEDSTGALTRLTGDDGIPVFPLAGNINVITGLSVDNSGATVGFSNSAAHTLRLNVTDVNLNTTIGNDAGDSAQSGSRNTALGSDSLSSLTNGSFNTAIGSTSGTNITSGEFNTLLGSRAGTNLETGSSNILVGPSAGTAYTTSESNNIILGPSAGTVSTSGEMRLGDFTNTTATYVAGIDGVSVGDDVVTVVTERNNKLGTANIVAGVGIEIIPGANEITIVNTGGGGGGGTNNTFFGSAPYNFIAGGSPTIISPFAGGSDNPGNPMVIPCAGTVNNMYVNVDANSSTTDVDLTLYKNGSPTTLTLVITGSGTGVFSNLVDIISVSSGDTLQFQTTATSGGNITGNISAQFSSTSGGGGDLTFVGDDGTTATSVSSVIDFHAQPLSGSSVEFTGTSNIVSLGVTDSLFNTLIGKSAGNTAPITGGTNTSLGASTLHALTSGSSNVAIGSSAGDLLTTGSNNIAIGDAAGDVYTTESNNIAINSTGVAADAGVLRIGSGTGSGPFQLQSAFISGINGVNVGDVSTVVTLSGDQLGSASITAGTGITITPSANTIEISATGGGGSGGTPVAFQAYLATNTGTGLTYPYGLGSTVAMTTEFNDGSGFYPGNGSGTPASFTAPVTGVYQFTLTISGSDSANTSFPCTTHPVIITPSATYYSPTNAGSGSGTSISPAQNSNTVVVSLNASDVVTFQSNIVGFGASTTRINGNTGGGFKQTWINGFLIQGSGSGTVFAMNGTLNFPGSPAYWGLSGNGVGSLVLGQAVMPRNGTFSNFYVNAGSNANTASGTYILNKNGSNTSLSVTVPASTTGIFSDTTHAVSVVAGDLISIVVSSATTGRTNGSMNLLFN